VPPILSLLSTTHWLNNKTIKQHRTRLRRQDTPHVQLLQTLTWSGETQCKRARAEPLTVPDVVLVMHPLYGIVLEETDWYL